MIQMKLHQVAIFKLGKIYNLLRRAGLLVPSSVLSSWQKKLFSCDRPQIGRNLEVETAGDKI